MFFLGIFSRLFGGSVTDCCLYPIRIFQDSGWVFPRNYFLHSFRYSCRYSLNETVENSSWMFVTYSFIDFSRNSLRNFFWVSLTAPSGNYPWIPSEILLQRIAPGILLVFSLGFFPGFPHGSVSDFLRDVPGIPSWVLPRFFQEFLQDSINDSYRNFLWNSVRNSFIDSSWEFLPLFVH